MGFKEIINGDILLFTEKLRTGYNYGLLTTTTFVTFAPSSAFLLKNAHSFIYEMQVQNACSATFRPYAAQN